MASQKSAKEESYVFDRNHAATSRLNYQYYLWQNAAGFYLHPDIPQLQPNAQVADVATGSGMWLLDLASSLPPTTRLTGLDISLAQCPPRAWLPHNVQLFSWDFFTEVPVDLVAKFDVVHIRLVAVTIRNNDPTVLVRNLARLLKPGGFLQWDELDTPTAHVTVAAPNLETEALEQLRELLISPMKGRNGETLLGSRDWIQAIPENLETNGFCDVRKHTYCEAPHMGVFWNDVISPIVWTFTANGGRWVLSAEEFADVMLKTDDTVKEKQLRSMALRASKESDAGAAVRYGKMSIIARKL
ncbi:hypothetical protein JMJ35_007376 [Cladonia borealis]|uniref:Methyltransferase type 12 domain-containing protein n=1 Tax=Cladonia borealis TaxID=184061 RepID=A0AA39UZQ2_9LECA|nr:hypothetical protein JMJ35_007376 [Cladonia borealis]